MVALTKTERRIYRALQERPRSAAQLREIVWANGGPCRHTIYVHIGNLNKRLVVSDEVVQRVVAEPDLDSVYKLVKTPRNLPAHKLDQEGIYVG
jgi:hypothetical protein